MVTTSGFYCLSIFELMDDYDKEGICRLLSDFKCTQNSEIEKFLHNNSYDFSVKYQAITYLIYSNETDNIVGYFSLSVKPIIIKSDNLSNRTLNKILRMSDFDEENKTVNPAAYLIAQLGKNDGADINIDAIFEIIDIVVSKIQKSCGGVVEFLESENEEKLVNMYHNKGFKTFNIRKSKSGEDRKLVQMYRLI